MTTAPETSVRLVSEAEFIQLSDIIRRRGVKRIAYFHCDHFEPWRSAAGSKTHAENAVEVGNFAAASAGNEFARRLTLFYKAHVPFRPNAPGLASVAADDPIGFVDRTAEQRRIYTEAMSGLLSRVDHDIQVHIHHEHYTSNTMSKSPDLQAAFARPEVCARDGERLELALRRSLAAIREETGLVLDTWHFVHGVWALNASDPSVCNITDEISILMRNGGRGDFSFPAGRPDVDPIHEQPFLIRPVDARRCYDLAEADPIVACGAAAMAGERFFIWASPIRHWGSSIDYFSPGLAERFNYPFQFAMELLKHSVVVDGTLWFKTHAHSMHTRYVQEGRETVYPHDYPPLRRIMGLIFDAATAADCEVDFVTASEAYQQVIHAQPGDEPVALATPYKAGGDDEAVQPNGPLGTNVINQLACETVLTAVEHKGLSQSGAGEYFSSRAERGTILMPYEIRIAELLLANPTNPRRAYEIGSGLSLLPMLLAANGITAVGIERDRNRAELGRDILDKVAAELPDVATHADIWANQAPAAIEGLDPQGAAIIFTNITSTISPEDVERLIQIAGKFDVAIVDLSRFFVVRDKNEQAELLQRLFDAGWHDSPQIRMPGGYRWFQK